MDRKIDITFNSEKDSNKGYFQIANGYISQTVVLFERESIVAVINAKGCVEFYNMDCKLLATYKLPSIESGKQVYEEVALESQGDLLILKFPIYEWIDNYPNCDGEHDRWDTRVIGHNSVTFDLTDNTAK